MALIFGVLSVFALTISFLSLPIAISSNVSYPAIFNFGDSNSDTGGIAAGIAFPIGPPNGQTFFLKPSGRLCDGRLIVDFLADAMGLPFLNPYLDSIGAPSFYTGCNFATGGSTIHPASAASISPFSFNVQVAQFIRFKARALQLLAQDKKLRKFLPSEDQFELGVYMFDMGQNDLDGAFYSMSMDKVLTYISTILSEFEAGLEKLYNAGARNFWIHNMRPLGCLPRIIAVFGKDPSKLDQLGCVDSHNRAAKQFNLQLRDLCTKFREQFSDIELIYTDTFSIMQSLISNHSLYGFKQPIAACCGYGGLPLNFDSRIGCGQTRNIDGKMASAEPCNNTAEYVNWDGNHFTEAANKFAFRQILTGNYSEPHLPANFALFLMSSLYV